MVVVDLPSLLAAVENSSPVEAVDALGEQLADAVQARHVALLINNLSGDALMRMSHVTRPGARWAGRNERAESLPLAGTVYEQVLFTQRRQVVEADGDDAWLALVPITERGDAIGILEVAFASEPGAEVLDELVTVTHAWAYVLIASRRHTDLFEWAQRDIPFSVSAEIQRRLLPLSYTAETGPLTLAGWLEPSHDVGGDTFDYSIDRDWAYLSITDAMGHDTPAALLATLAVGALRNRRRSLATPAEQAAAANELVATHAAGQFVTGLLMRIRLSNGTVEIVNAGHPVPFLARDGDVSSLTLTTNLPMGLASSPHRTDTVTLVPGDRLLMVTDGYLDRLEGRLDVEKFMRASLDRHPRQVTRELGRAVREVTGGQLHDDATALCLDWYGPGGSREATAGASRQRATQEQ